MVKAGQKWAGEGCTTPRCSEKLRNLTKVSLVSLNLQQCLHSFLYALVLVGELDVGTLQLSDGAAEASFRLAEGWATAAGSSSMPQAPQEPTKKDDEEDMAEGETPTFAWETPSLQLPPDPAALLTKAQAGERLDLKMFLENIPLWQGLKTRAEENNHRADGKGAWDRVLKGLQQKVLHILRTLACCTLYA